MDRGKTISADAFRAKITAVYRAFKYKYLTNKQVYTSALYFILQQ
jgi:hypothetical protein